MACFGELIFEEPGEIVAGASALRDALQPDIAGGPDRLAITGRAATLLVQHGVMLADSRGQLQRDLEALTSLLDGVPRTLRDDHGTEYSAVILRRVEPKAIERVGVRWRVRFEAQYIQLAAGEA
jgi:hypothetical protein